jgi:hypothetical protein
MDAHQVEPVSTLAAVRRADGWARERAAAAATELELNALRSVQ